MTPFNLVLLIFCCILLVILFMVWPAWRRQQRYAAFFGRYFAHRGLHSADGSLPENSMAAFAAAADAGYGIELDVRLSADGRVVVFHDDELARMCGQAARVDSMEWSRLQMLRLGDTAERIPLMEEVLALVAGRVPLIVELKHGAQNAQLCKAVWQLLQAYKGDYCIESFDPRVVGWFKKHAKQVLRGQLSAPPKALGGGAQGFVVGNLLCNFIGRPHFIAYAKGPKPFIVPMVESAAMRVVWTVRPPDDAEAMQAGSDAVIFEFFSPPTHYKDLPPEPDKGI